MKSTLKYRVKLIVPKQIWHRMANLQKKQREMFFLEQKKTFGNLNEDETIYVIRRRPPAAGLFSNVNHVLQGLIYSDRNKFLPVVDMENYSTEYSQFRKLHGSRNAWNYFFEPVSQINVEEAYKSRNVILSDGSRILKNHFMSGRNLAFALESNFLSEANLIYSRYIKLNNFTETYINYIYSSLEINANSTLGVFLRGGDYSNRPTGHPIQPGIEQVISDISDYLDNYGLNEIFLSTDDEMIRKQIVNRFGNLVLQNIRLDSEKPETKFLRQKFGIPDGSVARNISYLSEIYILSKLNFNLSSLSNGSAILYVINGNQFLSQKLYFYGVN
jgi:hypothetical protein